MTAPQMASGNADGTTGIRLSTRGDDTILKLKASVARDTEIFKDPFHPISNPDGIIAFGAQNTLQHEELTSYLNSSFCLDDTDFTYGTALAGSIRLNESLARFFNTYFAPAEEVVPDVIIAGGGVAAIVDQLVFHLADSGDGILIAAPYFSGFNKDLAARSNVTSIPVKIDPMDFFGPATLEAFEVALEQAKEDGITVSGVIINNPHNPIGQCYPRETIIEYARFCQRHNLHLISDEIYALSTFPSNDIPDPVPFVSLLSVDFEAEAGCDPARVHVMYGMGKDFNANGFRIGVLVSQHNPDLLTAMRSTAVLMKVSSPSDILWSKILNDSIYLPNFLSKNKKLLGEAYEYVTEWLNFHNIPYIPSNAGHYLMVNFRQFFPSHDLEGNLLPKDDNYAARNRELCALLNQQKLRLGTAAAFTWPEPGWFRLTFATPRDPFIVGLARIEDALGLERWVGSEPSGGKTTKKAAGVEIENTPKQVQN